MNQLRFPYLTLAIAFLSQLTSQAAEISKAQVTDDVFGPRVTNTWKDIDPESKQDRFNFSFSGFPELDYAISSSPDLEIWRRIATISPVDGTGTFSDPLVPDSPYFYGVAFDPAADASDPEWPLNAAITAPEITATSADLTWPAATDDNGIVAYAIYRDGEFVTMVQPSLIRLLSPALHIDGLSPNTVYEFDVVACDAGGNCTQLPTSLRIRTRSQQEPSLNAPRANSVFLASGEFTLSRTDLAIPARELGFTFTRTYRSDLERSGPLGYGWSANIYERLRIRSNGDVAWQQGSGRTDTFRLVSTNTFTSPPGVFSTLSQSPTGFAILSPNGTTRNFDLEGRIQTITTRNNNTLTYKRTANQLTSIVDDMGRETTFAYDGNNRIQTITDFSGRSVSYTYDANGNLFEARSPLVTGTPNGNNFPAGKIERYLYDDTNPDPDLAHNLVGVIAPNEVHDGSATPSQRMTYGDSGHLHDRILTHTIGGTNSTSIPAGGTITYTYLAASTPNSKGLISRTTITDRRGNQTHHDFSTSGHLVRKTEVLADQNDAVTGFSYDGEGNLVTLARPEGNILTHTFDSAHSSRRSQGNLLRTVHSPGPRGGAQESLTSRFTYEPIFNQLRSSTDPRTNTTTYSFDYEEGCDFTAIGNRIGLDATATQTLLNEAEMCNGPGGGDLNQDGITDQVFGNVIRRSGPTATLIAGSPLALLEGDTSQEVVDLYRYNQFSQRIAHLDADLNLHLTNYHPESDPNGDGITDNPAGNTTTGGYPATTTGDANGAAATTHFSYNPRGSLTSSIDPRGTETRSILNALDQPVRLLRAASTGNGTPDPEPVPLTAFSFVTEFHYDANNNLVRTDVEDRNNTSDTGGTISTITAFDILNQTVAVTEEISDALTRTSGFRYDPNGNRTVTIHPEGNATTHQYDERDLLTATTRGATSPTPESLVNGNPTYNPRGGTPSTRTYTYDGNANRVTASDGADTDGSNANNGPDGGDISRYQYDGYDRLVGKLDPTGNVSTSEYDANDNVVRTRRTGPDGGATPTSPAPSNNPLSDTRFVYDERNRLVQTDRVLFVNDPASAPHIAEGAADLGKGDLVPGDGAVNTRYDYDALDRLTFKTQDDEDTSQTEYDGLSRVVRKTDPLGNTVDYAYDDSSNLIETSETDVSTAAGIADEVFLTTFFYDSLNRLVARVDNLGHTTRYAYDSRDNLIQTTDSNGPPSATPVNRRAFPEGASTVNNTNSHGNVVRYHYDGLNRRIQTDKVLTATGRGNGAINPSPDNTQGSGDGVITHRIFYDDNDLVTERADDKGYLTTYTYDNLNRVVSETQGGCTTDPGDGSCPPPTTITYVYDPDNNLVRKVDEAGNSFSHQYDALNRRIQSDITPAAGFTGVTQQGFEYDGLNRLTRTTDNHGPVTTEYTYDSISRLVRETVHLPGNSSHTTTSTWRAENLRAGITYPTGTVVNSTFDSLDRPLALSDTIGPITDYDYLGSRLLTEAYPNGTANSFRNGYDGIRRPTGLTTGNSGGATLLSYDYTWDRTSNRRAVQKGHNPEQSESYLYDSAYRLNSVNRPNPTPIPATWQLDGNGNWSQSDLQVNRYNSFNELTEIQPEGQPSIPLTNDDNGNRTVDAGPFTYTYDALNRLTSATHDRGTTTNYFYDAAGRRVMEQTGPATTAYLHDGSHVIVDFDLTNSTPLREFVFGPGIDRPVRYENDKGEQFFYHRNSLGSTTALTPAIGNGIEHISYETYGQPTITQNDLAPTGNPYLFTGRRLDSSTGNYYYRSRYLDPATGRFLTRDSIGPWGDPNNQGNSYAYANNNPVNNTDPSGHSWIVDFEVRGDTEEASSYTQGNDVHFAPGQHAVRREGNAYGDHIGAYNFIGTTGVWDDVDIVHLRSGSNRPVQDHIGNFNFSSNGPDLHTAAHEAAHVIQQRSSGIVFPDVCKTPTPGGPIPIPYPNIGNSNDSGSPTALVNQRYGGDWDRAFRARARDSAASSSFVADTVAHEMGHNFGAQTPQIMHYPQGNGSQASSIVQYRETDFSFLSRQARGWATFPDMYPENSALRMGKSTPILFEAARRNLQSGFSPGGGVSLIDHNDVTYTTCGCTHL